MKVVIIGSGNAALVLGKKIFNAGHEIMQVTGRNETACMKLAALFNTAFTVNWRMINRHADLYIIAIADAALNKIDEYLQLDKKLTVHTAGAVSKEVLKNVSENYGVLYPLQSLRGEKEPLPEIPFLVDANTRKNILLIEEFAQTFSSKVQAADDETRKKIHLAAVLVNNFVNHLYTLTEDYCKKEKLDFTLLYPLIKETAEKIENSSPAAVQTGPAARGDEPTIKAHLQILNEYPQLKDLYKMFTGSISEHYRKH